MGRTLLQLVQQATGEMGLSQPSAVIGSTNNQTAQLRALAQRLGLDLVREFEWQRATKAYVFQTTAATSLSGTTTSASASVTGLSSTAALSVGMVVSGTGIRTYSEISIINSGTAITLNMPATASGTVTLTFATQDYSLPSDYDRMVADTHWDRNSSRINFGPKSSQEWQWLQGGLIAPIGNRYRIYNNKVRIFPALTTVYNMAFEYVSQYWVIATGGTAATKSSFTADTDESIFPDDLMLAGLKFYFLKAKKLDFGVEEEDFNRIRATRQAQDVPVGKMSMTPTPSEELVGTIPEGGWSVD